MKRSKAEMLIRATQRVLAAHREIALDQLRHHQQVATEAMQVRATVSQHRHDIAQRKLAVIESAARIQTLLPKPAPDPVKQIAADRERTLAQHRASAEIRAELAQQLQAEASQAALDRAAFVAHVRGSVAEELQDEAIDTYDRAIYEGRGGGGA